MEPIYNIDYNRLIRWLVPPQLRNAFILAWTKALISPVAWLYNSFIAYWTDVNYRTAITPQVCYLQKVLNDTFDASSRRITVIDNPGYSVILIHQDSAQLPVFTHQEGSGHDADIPIIHDNSNYSGTYDFVVQVPFVLTQTELYRMASILNAYKLASKRYKIMQI
ncbi:MAG: hypothetical protein JXB49_26065 [Bacteroidales bacterium]|nr:hypothetical protein [Bacteroidales bacterium]